jgi:hypothetical protein
MTVGGLAVGLDSYTKASAYADAAEGTMEGFEGYSREDVETLQVRAMRHALAAFLLVPTGILGLVGCAGGIALAGWHRAMVLRTGGLAIVSGAAQVALLWVGQLGRMWIMGIALMVFGLVFVGWGLAARRVGDGPEGEPA